jgi:Phosphotransferase enzyme family
MRACERPGVTVGASAARSGREVRPFLAYGGSPEARLPATAQGAVRAAQAPGPGVTRAPGMKIGALQAYLKAQGLELAGPLHADLIPGGRSNLTYAVTDGARRRVVRRPPAAGLTASAHDMAREWRVTSALRATRVPVARPVSLCQDQRVMGRLSPSWSGWTAPRSGAVTTWHPCPAASCGEPSALSSGCWRRSTQSTSPRPGPAASTARRDSSPGRWRCGAGSGNRSAPGKRVHTGCAGGRHIPRRGCSEPPVRGRLPPGWPGLDSHVTVRTVSRRMGSSVPGVAHPERDSPAADVPSGGHPAAESSAI